MKNITPMISVIVPVYNSEKFLKKCLTSIVNQTYKNFEVIIIDDGSTDLSKYMIEEFVSRHDNFIFKTQKHSGQGIARNFALSLVRGKFIAFVDSDDFVEKQFLQKLYEAIKENDADISCCSLNLYYPNKKLKIPFPAMPIGNKVLENDRAFKMIIKDKRIQSFPCNKLFKKSLFDLHQSFFKNMYFEDMVLIPELFFYAKRVAVISKSMYNYTQHRSSTVGLFNEKKIQDLISSLEYTKDFLIENNCFEKYNSELLSRAERAKLFNAVKIFQLHFFNRSFKNLFKNFKNMSSCVDASISSDCSFTNSKQNYKFELFH